MAWFIYQDNNFNKVYDSIYKDHKRKLQIGWLGPYEIEEVYSNGGVKVITIDPIRFSLLSNGHRLHDYT